MAQEPIGQRIKFLITALNLTIRKFAHALDVGETNIRNYLDRGTKPSSDVLEKIVYSFPQVNMVWLLTGEGQPFIPGVAQTEDPSVPYKKTFKHSIVVGGDVGGSATTNHGVPVDLIMQLENTKLLLIEAKRYSEQLERQLDDKERTIQILLGQQPKP